MRAMVCLSCGGMLVLLAVELLMTPPAHLPHLHPTLNALFCSANLAVAYALGVYWQWRGGIVHGEVEHSKKLQ